MNSWPTDQQYNMMPQMMGMQNPMMPANQMPMMPANQMPPMPGCPPMGNHPLMGNVPNDWNHMMNAPQNSGNFIGPIPPAIPQEPPKEGNQSENKGSGNKNGGDSRRDKDRRSGRTPDRRDRNDQRSRSDRRDRRSKWDNQQNMPNNMMMDNMPQGNMMQYPNNMMDMTMPNMGPMGMMPNMPLMPNMIDQNQMMMAQMQMQMGQHSQPVGQQAIFISNGVLLPPMPGASIPARREKPPGCRTIFIGGLPNVTKEIVIEMFQRFGDIKDVKLHRQGVCHVRFEKQDIVEQSFFLSGFRYKLHDQTENEATTLFVDYALNREDQEEYDKNKRRREPTPPKVEPFTPANLTTISDKIKSDTDFAEVAPTLAGWLERGECNKKNANIFYSLIQASNSQIRRLYNEKMQIDEEYQNLKTSLRDRFASVISQFEQVAKILSVAKHQRVSDHFSKQQRRNIEMWLKMTEDLENMREEFNTMFDEDDTEAVDNKNMVPLKKYEALRSENENLVFELEGYRNEAHLAKDEAERKFEKFKAQYIAQQALQQNPHGQVFPPLPPPPLPNIPPMLHETTRTPQDLKPSIPQIEAKLISVLTAYLLAQPLGSTLENLVNYVKSIIPHATQAAVHNVLRKYGDLFKEQGASRWMFVTFDIIKKEKL